MGCNRAGEPRRIELEISPALHRRSGETSGSAGMERGDTLKQIEKMLAEARAKRSWGEISITIKDGKPVLIRQTIQHKAEDSPATYEPSPQH